MIFHFDHMFIDHGPGGKYDPEDFTLQDFKRVFMEWDKAIGDESWLSILLDNHDFPRMISRFGNDKEYRVESAKLLAVLILTHRGTPSIYQGSEIGMGNVAFDSLEDYRDVKVENELKEIRSRGGDLSKFLKTVHRQGRDNARTPMQWDASVHAEFTSGIPWINLHPDFECINVAMQENDPDSILNF